MVTMVKPCPVSELTRDNEVLYQKNHDTSLYTIIICTSLFILLKKQQHSSACNLNTQRDTIPPPPRRQLEGNNTVIQGNSIFNPWLLPQQLW